MGLKKEQLFVSEKLFLDLISFCYKYVIHPHFFLDVMIDYKELVVVHDIANIGIGERWCACICSGWYVVMDNEYGWWLLLLLLLLWVLW